MADLPSGTVTFLFTDIEGSTKLAQQHPGTWEAARRRHHAILHQSSEVHRGQVFQIVGDAFCIVFRTAADALNTSVAAQRALQAEAWGETPVRVRMGLHTGAAEFHAGEYHGYLTLAHVQRVMSAAYGGQTLMSNATAALLAGQMSDGVTLRDMGEQRLKGLLHPERIYQVMVPDLRSDFPSLQTLDPIPNNLPIQVTSFVGRERELRELQHLLTTTRLLTLTGSGGTGKTRLSLQVAAEVLDNYKDGVWFVELASLSAPSFVPQTVGSTLSVREEPGQPILQMLTEHLRDKHLLLLLDNCEHLIEACARFADAVLRAAPHLKILATSREALGIAGESIWRVPSLTVPDPHESPTVEQLKQYASVRLFEDRATQVLATFRITNSNAPAVTQVCYQLEGIPLAIELAAARVKALRVEQIAGLLDDRFRLLTGGSRTALPRHQTLRGTIDWSYSLLSGPERTLLRRLSVFAGGWTLEAAEEVAKDEGGRMKDEGKVTNGDADLIPPSSFVLHPSEVLDLLTHLVDKSLVVLDDQAVEPRYRMLETIRQYAAEKLHETDEQKVLKNRHLAYFAQWVEEAEPKLHGREQTLWFDRLEVDYDNLRGAMDWSILYDETVEAGLRLAGSLWWFWWNRAHASEGQDRLVGILLRAGAFERNVAHVKALNAAAAMQWSQGHYAEANPFLQEALTIGRELPDRQYLASSLQFQGVVAFDQGNYATARSALEEALSIRKSLGDKWGVGFLLNNLGDIAFIQDDLIWAQALGEEALGVLRELNERSLIPYTFRQLGRLAHFRGDYANAMLMCNESLRLNTAAGDMRGMAACVAALAGIAATLGQSIRAVRLLGAADAAVGAIVSPFLPADLKAFNRTMTSLHAQLDDAAFASAWAEGRALTLEQAVDEAKQVTIVPHASATSAPAMAYPAGLSAREVDVVRLVAKGLTIGLLAGAFVLAAPAKAQAQAPAWIRAAPAPRRPSRAAGRSASCPA